MEMHERKLTDVLKRVRTDPDGRDAGRDAKRKETEALRAALMYPPPVISNHSSVNSVPFGIREGQTVVSFDNVKNKTGINSLARADGYMWNPLRDREEMDRQPFTVALMELGNIQRIIDRDPNRRFINMYATKTNQRVQAMYDQDKLRVLASREAELVHARRLDRERKIVNTPEKQKQLIVLRKEMEIVEGRHQRLLVDVPRLNALVDSSLGFYFIEGHEETEKTLEYFIEQKNTALVVERMAVLYLARKRTMTSPNLKNYNLTPIDAVEVRDTLKRLWGNLDAGQESDYTSNVVPESPSEESKLLTSHVLNARGSDDRALELLLSGYALNMFQRRGYKVDAPVYTVLAKEVLKKILNYFMVGLNENQDAEHSPASFEDFMTKMAPFIHAQLTIGHTEDPYSSSAMDALLDQLRQAAAELKDSMPPRSGQPNAENNYDINDDNIKREGANIRSRRESIFVAEKYVNSISDTIEHLVAHIRLLETPLEQPSRKNAFDGDSYDFNVKLMNLVMKSDPASLLAFNAWRTNNTRPRLSAVLTTSTGAYVEKIANCMALTFEALSAKNGGSSANKELVTALSAQGLVQPTLLEDVFQVLQLSLGGVFSTLYTHLLHQHVFILDETMLATFRWRRDNFIVAKASLEEKLVTTSTDYENNNPLRLMFATYALNAAVTSSKQQIEKLIIELQKRDRALVGATNRVRGGATASPSPLLDEYVTLGVSSALSASLLLKLAAAKLKIMQHDMETDRTLLEKMQDDIRSVGDIISDIASERTSMHGILNPSDPDAYENQRSTYQQPLAWAELPEVSGMIFLSGNVSGQLDSARLTLGVDFPALRAIPMHTLTTNFESALPEYFCEYAAVKHARDELGHSTNVMRDKQFALNKLRLYDVSVRLRRYSYSKSGPRITVYCDGRAYSDQQASSDMGSLPSVGLF
jgi:hypothetical protein